MTKNPNLEKKKLGRVGDIIILRIDKESKSEKKNLFFFFFFFFFFLGGGGGGAGT